MSDVVIAALIGAAASILVNLINNFQQSKKRAVEEARKDAELQATLASIGEKLDTHNGYAEKIGGMSIDIAVIKNELKNIRTGGIANGR